MAVVVTQGETASLRFQLLEDGVAIDLTPFTVTLELSDRFGTAVTTTGLVTLPDAANGYVDLTPSSTTMFDVVKSPYAARFKLVDVSNGISYVPRGLREQWTVVAT